MRAQLLQSANNDIQSPFHVADVVPMTCLERGLPWDVVDLYSIDHHVGLMAELSIKPGIKRDLDYYRLRVLFNILASYSL